jgi:hypothetical protein
VSELKTQVNDASVDDFLNAVPDETKRRDSFVLLDVYKRVTGEPAKMWGASMVGFGLYHYKSARSTQEGDWPLAAFSPRKRNLTLYIMPGFAGYSSDLYKLGKHKTSKACLYINKLTDVDLEVLERLVRRSYEDAKERLT